MTGLSASTTWALMLHLASAALAMQCGFVPEAAALMAPTETVDKNTLLRDALRWLDAWTSCLAAIALVSSPVRCCSLSREEPSGETRLKIFALGRMDRSEESCKIVRVRQLDDDLHQSSSHNRP